MSIVVFGLNHRTVPIELLERATIPAGELPKALHGLCSRPNVAECVVLSTCNRTEVYAVAERYHGAYQDLRDFFCDLTQLAPEALNDHLYSQHDAEAVAHLFAVTAGLDSAVLGETEILGQVKTAWELAQREKAARSSLNLLFRHALEVGKRVRTETAISRSTASVSYAAVEMATGQLGSLRDRNVLVIGVGEMGEGMTMALARAGCHVTVANRTVERAVALAERVGGTAVGLDAVPGALAGTDVVLTSIGAGVPVVTPDVVRAARVGRDERPLLIVDIAVPRDVEPAVGALPGVTLLDLDDVRDWAARGRAEREAEVTVVRHLVAEEVVRFDETAAARQAAPLIAQLHERAERLRRAEIDRHRCRLGGLDEQQWEAVEALTRGLLAKVLHDPVVRLKDDAGTPRGERAASVLRDLFDLP